MLVEMNINPMAPWDNELPKFVTDPRYTGASLPFRYLPESSLTFIAVQP